MDSLRWIRRTNGSHFDSGRAGTAAAVGYVIGGIIGLGFGIDVLMTTGNPWLLLGVVALLAGVEVVVRASSQP